ncbi:MAG: acyltransferase [Proteobacteria bacterium]|nr:acyltransferase [Pseudomonadota bacterium]
MSRTADRLRLRALQLLDRLRLWRLRRRHPGLVLEPGASTNFAHARFDLAPGARVTIEAGAVTERRRDGVVFDVGPGGQLTVGAGTWLRSDRGPVHLIVYDGARLTVGPECFLNACQVSAKLEVTLGRRAWVGPGSRIYDADQHDLDAERPERRAPVRIGDCAWITSDATVLRGVEMGAHSVLGTRSVLLESVPPHTFVAGTPARPLGRVGDRSRVR